MNLLSSMCFNVPFWPLFGFWLYPVPSTTMTPFEAPKPIGLWESREIGGYTQLGLFHYEIFLLSFFSQKMLQNKSTDFSGIQTWFVGEEYKQTDHYHHYLTHFDYDFVVVSSSPSLSLSEVNSSSLEAIYLNSHWGRSIAELFPSNFPVMMPTSKWNHYLNLRPHKINSLFLSDQFVAI